MPIKWLLPPFICCHVCFCTRFRTIRQRFFSFFNCPPVSFFLFQKKAVLILSDFPISGFLCPSSFCPSTAVRYCLSGLPVDCQIKNITNPDQTNLLLEDLIIWTNYEIEVGAYNGAGRGTYSHKVTEWTLQGGQCQFPKYSDSFFV